jgi:hypothetical protein
MKPIRWMVVAALSWSAVAGERWRMSYSYDPPDASEFRIADLEFASPQRGMAVGVVESGKKGRPYAVATLDGGKTWKPIRIPVAPDSLYFVNENSGWLVGGDDIWGTSDFGQTWKKLAGARGAWRVWFLNEKQGWAIGEKKSVYETSDGGAKWTPLPAAAEPKTTPEHTVYSAIAFADAKNGVIAGWSKPPRRGDRAREPEWLDPENQRREWPTVSVLLQTRDGGRTWQASESALFGRITRIGMAPDGRGLGLLEFFDRFDYPSEVYRFDWRTGKSERSFRREDRAVTDLALPGEGPAYLAAIEPPGRLARSPVPGKLKILKSQDLVEWVEMTVDYRAVGRRAMLAATAGSGAWVATDIGMVLRLAPE